MTVVTGVILLASLGLGDQRRTVVFADPSPGDAVSSAIQELSITFNVTTDHDAVERNLSIQPAVGGVARWRGRTLEYFFSNSLKPGKYTLTIAAGNLGTGAQRLAEPYVLDFTAREPGIAVVVPADGHDSLVAIRDGVPATTLMSAGQIADLSVSPDGQSVAVIASDGNQNRLVLVDSSTGSQKALVDSPAIDLGGVTWSPDSQALLVARRDRLADSSEGVPRLWLMRLSGEFVGPIDSDGLPTQFASWSPDAQTVAYISPSNAQLTVRNLSTKQTQSLGEPRGEMPAWSPDSRLVAFDSAPSQVSQGAIPAQPVRVRSLDGSVDRFFGQPGEVRSEARFVDNKTVVSLRRTIGGDSHTDLIFELVETGAALRTVPLTSGTESVSDWDLNPQQTEAVYTVQTGTSSVVMKVDLESGQRTTVLANGVSPHWLP